jgi:Icc-related predicted phosphoesterase
METMTIGMMSDLHGIWKNREWQKEIEGLPKCDLILNAGDYCTLGMTKPRTRDFYSEVTDFSEWFAGLPGRDKITIQGNHEPMNEEEFTERKEAVHDVAPNVHFVAQGLVTIRGVKIYCSSGTSSTYKWAWSVDEAGITRPRWSSIPYDTDILLTHKPPLGTLDKSIYGYNLGNRELFARVVQLMSHSLSLHVFGHVHDDRGIAKNGNTLFVNASICDRVCEGEYVPAGPVRILNFQLPKKAAALDT